MHPVIFFDQLLYLCNGMIPRAIIYINQFKIQILFLEKRLILYKLVVKVPYIFFFIVARNNRTQ